MTNEPEPNSAPLMLLVKAGCSLCVKAEAVLEPIAAEFGLSVAKIYAEEAPELAQHFAEEIPVLFVDGQVRDFWVIDPQRVRKLLAARIS